MKAHSSPIDGVLVVDKPAGPTSFDVVQRVRRLLRADKAGHTGTLDPAATGVLAVCVGEAVKLQQYLTEGDKAYEATVAFGAATDTEDATGTVIERGDPSRIDAAAIEAALPRLVGEIEQLPPMYSAVRVGGRRLHQAARAGESVERTPRKVMVHALELLELLPTVEGLVRVRLGVRCGKGTYVRTLAVELGKALAVPAHLAALRRTESGPFSISQSVTIEEAQSLAGEQRLQEKLVSLADSLRFLPAVALSLGEVRDLSHGKALQVSDVPEGLARALDPLGRLVAVCRAQEGVLKPVRVFPLA